MGKIKEKFLLDAVNEYSKRLSRYCSLDIAEIPPVSLPEAPSQREITAALQKEAELIRRRIPKNADVTALCVEGRQMSSEAFAKKIRLGCDCGRPQCFIIGSSYGLDERLKSECQSRLSISEMTFPHRLFRVMLLEQIYRAFKINEGGSYHK